MKRKGKRPEEGKRAACLLSPLSLSAALAICTAAVERGANRHLSASEKSSFLVLAEFVEEAQSSEAGFRTEANTILIWRYLLSPSFHVDGGTALELERMVADVREGVIV